MGNLLTRRALAFLLAIALAVLAAVAVSNYVQGVESRTATEAQQVTILVATDVIEVGTPAETMIELGLFEAVLVPRGASSRDGITSQDQIADRVVQEVILAGDQLVDRQFASPLEAAEVLTIPPEHQAISVQLEIPPGVAGFVRRDDFVSVIASLDVSEASGAVDAGPDGQIDAVTGGDRSAYLLQNVQVLAVGRRVESSDAGGADATVDDTGGVLLTLAVRPSEAERLVFASENGTLWLTLLPSDETEEAVTTPGRTVDNVFDES